MYNRFRIKNSSSNIHKSIKTIKFKVKNILQLSHDFNYFIFIFSYSMAILLILYISDDEFLICNWSYFINLIIAFIYLYISIHKIFIYSFIYILIINNKLLLL
jgi:uncharacterized membrane protein YjjP (DUF1212 family)